MNINRITQHKSFIYQSVFGLMALCLLIWQLIPNDDLDMGAELDLHTPYWFSSNVVITEMDENGIPESEFRAAKLFHYSNAKITDILQPVFTMFHPERAPWQLTSDKGRTFHGRHTSDIARLDLWHDVLLQQIDGHKTTEMRTSTIAVFPEEEFAHTDQSVMLLQPGQKLSGVGMRADFAKDALQLFSSVRSEHDARDL